jgi:hypothetical protein
MVRTQLDLPVTSAMERPRVRFTVRQMMIVVAVVAVLMSSYTIAMRMRHLSAYRYMVRYHRQHERTSVIAVRDSLTGQEIAGVEELDRLTRTKSAYHAAMRRKYERAVAQPWITIPVDPPDPVLNQPGRSVDIHYGD